MTEVLPRPPGPMRQLMQQRDFVLFLLARGLGLLATHMLTVAIGWHIYLMTDSFLALGMIGLFQFAPSLALFPLTGLTADRFDRRRVLTLCHLVQALACCLLLALNLSDTSEVWPYYATLSVYGAARAFLNPATRALMPNLVPYRLFPNAVACNSTFSKLSSFSGPALSGLLVAQIGNGVYAVMAVLFTMATIGTLWISARPGRSFATAVNWDVVLGGVSYILRSRVLLGAISLDLFAVLFGTVLGILPVFARDILNVGPEGLGIMRAMPAVGAFVVAAVLAQLPPLRRAGPLLFATLLAYGLCIIVFGLSDIFWLSVAVLAVYGAIDMVSICIRQTMVQMATPDEMRGRVAAVDSIFTNGSEELGNFRSGVMAAAFGPAVTVVLGGVLTIAITGLWWRWFPDLRRVDRLDLPL